VTLEQFSRRHGFSAAPAEILIRNDAPQNVRGALLMILEGELQVRPTTIRDWLCTILRELPDQNNWSEYPNIWQECQNLMYCAPWYRVYDFVELVYDRLANSQDLARANQWANAVNEYFVESGVGWRLVDGQLESRGQEAFEMAVDSARQALDEATLTTAKQEIHEALRDLSRRPDPDLTGAVQHAMAALECTARQVTNDPRATLGEILRRHPDIVPRPLDESLSRMWGYASEMARHIREGRTPGRPEVELIVTVAAAVCTYLAQALASSVAPDDVPII
jgi:AbiJ N-terminal domain 4